ncbi:MAG TPA: tetratricopeptide repeat protein [Gemmataceae bacterium]|jgi:Tfp pilus assembly protein PilF|nr:tetratricopeptide repeat protein [Gemmataceae bacterium]
MCPAPLFLIAALVAAPAPAKPRDPWVGVVVCLKSSSPETYQPTKDGELELQAFRFRYLDVRCTDEKGDFVAVQCDDQVVWVKKESVLRPRDAINHYTAVLDKDPTDERAISCRAWAYMAVHELDRALKDAEEAVRLNPESTAWKNNRGECFIKRKEYDKAIAEFSDLLTTNPRYFFPLYNRAEAYLRSRQFAKAKADLDTALATEPRVPGLHMYLARVYATAPDARLRDGKKAVESAKKAVDMIKYRDGRYLDTLAAAYAEAGDFDKAVETQQKALDDPDFMKEESEGARHRLTLYRDKKPFRDE